MKKFCVCLLLFFSLLSSLVWKYFQSRKTQNWLAKVNNNLILKKDYFGEIKRLKLTNSKEIKGNIKIKKAILDQLIEKEVLLEEARRLNIDKEEDFLFLVESFWKKLMIQKLLLKKTKDISKKISMNPRQIEDYSKVFDFKIYARIRVCSRKKIALKLMKKEFLSYEEQKFLLKDSSWVWLSYEEVHSAYRKVLFSMKENSSKVIYHYNFGWICLDVDRREKRKFKSNLEKQLIFLNVLKEDMDINLIKKWMIDLKNQHRIFINKKILNQMETIKADGKK